MKGFSEQEKNELIEMAKLSKKTGSSLSKVFLEFARKNKRAGGSVRNYYYFLIKHERLDEKELQSKTVEPFTKCETVEIIEKILTGTANGKSVRRVIDELTLGNAKKALRIQNKYRNVISCDRPLVELVMKGLKQKGVSFKNPYDNKKEKNAFLYKRLQREINGLFEKIALKEKKINEKLRQRIDELEGELKPEKSKTKDFFPVKQKPDENGGNSK